MILEREKILAYLKEAASSKFLQGYSNPFFRLGFDGEKPRLGWFSPPEFRAIENNLTEILEVCKDKENFIFSGMGGSINGIKTLKGLSGNTRFFLLDSLDPEGFDKVLTQIKNLKKTMVICISKSGSTLETQLIAHSLREQFKQDWLKHFIWLSDSSSFEKLTSGGWMCAKFPIQIDGAEDIGGRFSCPHTLIFLFPLFLLIERDLQRLEDIWRRYLSLRESLIIKAYQLAYRAKDLKEAIFSVYIEKEYAEDFSGWIIQLFQESLGSKTDELQVKTQVISEDRPFKSFLINSGLNTQDPFIYIMGNMFFLQMFVVFYSVFKEINFVNQPYVEVYKSQLKTLKDEKLAGFKPKNLEEIIRYLKERISEDKQFIEVVLYFYSDNSYLKDLRDIFKKAFPHKEILVFTGSDWNHHSYQAAFKDKLSWYVFLVRHRYKDSSPFLDLAQISKNTSLLKAISYVTYSTLKDKAFYFSLQDKNLI